MQGRGDIGGADVTVEKSVTISQTQPNDIRIQYQLQGLPRDVPLHFASEFNFATMPGGASDRYFYDTTGTQLGTLDSQQQLDASDRIGLVDEWQGLDVSLELSAPAGIWTFPIETISQSESGFELVHQSVAVVPHWEFVAADDGKWSAEIRLILDTSLARARQLAQIGEERKGWDEEQSQQDDVSAEVPSVT
jgi:alpha-amylase